MSVEFATLRGSMPDSATNIVTDSSDTGFMADVVEASNDIPVIVDFWAPWCGPCKQLLPRLEKAVTEAGGKVKLVKINTQDNPNVAGQLGVRSIPAVYGFKNCLLYTSPSPRDATLSRMPSSA